MTLPVDQPLPLEDASGFLWPARQAARLTLEERAENFARVFVDQPASHLQIMEEGQGRHRHSVLYGRWVIGARYGNATRFYGAYPATYLDRVMALFPDVVAKTESLRIASSDTAGRLDWPILHAFSGSLPAGPYVRMDLHESRDADVYGNVYNAKSVLADFNSFELVFADPPYTARDAEQYETPGVNRGRAMRGLARVVKMGGFVVWLDTSWPMHRLDEWRTVARIGLTRSTNHRERLVTIFERVGRDYEA